jgi:hypothetical protein
MYLEDTEDPTHPPEHEHVILLGMVSDNRIIKELYHPTRDYKILESNLHIYSCQVAGKLV